MPFIVELSHKFITLESRVKLQQSCNEYRLLTTAVSYIGAEKHRGYTQRNVIKLSFLIKKRR